MFFIPKHDGEISVTESVATCVSTDDHVTTCISSTSAAVAGPGSSSACSAYCASGLKPRASNFSGPPSKVYNIFDTVIGLSYLCCHSALYSLNNPSVIFLAQLHSISEYCRILINPHHRRLYSNTLSSSRVVTTIEADELPRLIFLRKNREREQEEEEREGKLLKANFNFNHQP
jgi:hypothetical protein